MFGLSSRVVRIRLLGIAHDLICAAVSLPIAMFLRVGALPDYGEPFWLMVPILAVTAGISFFLIGLNRGSWRYASIQELIRIIQAAVLSILIASILTFAITRLEGMPRSVPVVACVIMVLLMVSTRIGYRILKERHLQRMFKSDRGGERVLIVGFSDEASAFLRHLAMQRHPAYHVVGILDHGNRHVGRRMDTVKVLGSVDDVADIVARFRDIGAPISKIVASPTKMDPPLIEKLLVEASEFGVSVFMLPEVAELTEKGAVGQIKPKAVKLDDLLERRVADIDLTPVGALLRDKVILITGAGGSIGTGLVEQTVSFFPRKLIIVDSSEHNLYIVEQMLRERFPYQAILPVLADIRESETMRALMLKQQPDMVFHVAALKHVPMVEHNPMEGAKTNILGTMNVADAALAARVAVFVMISTDKAVNPTNVMGATKRFAEAYCQNLDCDPNSSTRFVTVRFGNVLGSSGSVVPLFARQIENGGPLTITHPDMKRYFMSMKEAVRLVLTACAKSVANPQERGKIMVLHMGAQLKIVDIAHRMIRLAGLRPGVDIEVVFTGLRPGEKLYEERLAASEVVEPTSEDWLQVASPRQNNADIVARGTERLRDALSRRDEKAMVEAIRIVVPEFVADQTANSAQPDALPKTVALVDARRRLRPVKPS